MKKINFGFWLIHFPSLSKELVELREDIEKIELGYEKSKKKLFNEIDVLKLRVEKLNDMLTTKTNRILVLDKAVADRNKEIQELHYELSKVNLKLDKKIKAFNKIRGSIGGYQKELNKLRKEFSLAKKKIDFLQSKIPKKTLEDIKAYDYGRREVLKRNKLKESNTKTI